MSWWSKGKAAPTQTELETQQAKLQRLSREVVERYQREMSANINSPEQLRHIYGAPFADAGVRRQAGIVATMATQMLDTPSGMVTVVTPDKQESVALVLERVLQSDENQISSHYDDSYCKFVIGTGREFAVSVSADHPLVCDTTFATSGMVVAYLGVPVANPDRYIVGTLCVWDSQARDWKAADVGILTQLSFVLTRAMRAVGE